MFPILHLSPALLRVSLFQKTTGALEAQCQYCVRSASTSRKYGFLLNDSVLKVASSVLFAGALYHDGRR